MQTFRLLAPSPPPSPPSLPTYLEHRPSIPRPQLHELNKIIAALPINQRGVMMPLVIGKHNPRATNLKQPLHINSTTLNIPPIRVALHPPLPSSLPPSLPRISGLRTRQQDY